MLCVSYVLCDCYLFCFSSRRRHTRCALVTGVQTCALPIYDRTAGVIDALAQQVWAEPTLLALDHVGQRLQRAAVGASNGATATAVVEQCIDRDRKSVV